MKTILSDRIETEKLEEISSMLKVIAHPIRLDIVDLLSRHSELTVLEIQNFLLLEQAIASQHLILMKDKGVLKSKKIGRNRYFSLQYPHMQTIIECMENCFSPHF